MTSILAKRKELPGGDDGPLKKRRFRRPMSTAAPESTPSGEGSAVGAPPATSETPGRIVVKEPDSNEDDILRKIGAQCKKRNALLSPSIDLLKFLDRHNFLDRHREKLAEKREADQTNTEDVMAAAVEEEAAAEAMVEQHMVNVEEPFISGDGGRRTTRPIPYWKAHGSTATVNDEVDGDDSGNKDGKGVNGGDKDGDRSNIRLKPTPGQVKIGSPKTNKTRRRRCGAARARASKKNQNKSGSTEFRVDLPLPSNRCSRHPHNRHKPSSAKLAPLVQRKGSRGEVSLRHEERNTYCAGGLHVLDALHYALGAEGTTMLISDEDCKRTPQFRNKGYIDFAVLHQAMSDKKLPYSLVKKELGDLSPFNLLQLPGGIYLVRVKVGTKGRKKGCKKEDHFICVNTWTKWIFYPDRNPEMCHLHYSDSDTASKKAANKVMDDLGITEICQARLVRVVLEHAPRHHR